MSAEVGSISMVHDGNAETFSEFQWFLWRPILCTANCVSDTTGEVFLKTQLVMQNGGKYKV